MIQNSNYIASVNSTTNIRDTLPSINTMQYSYEMINNKRKEPVSYIEELLLR